MRGLSGAVLLRALLRVVAPALLVALTVSCAGGASGLPPDITPLPSESVEQPTPTLRPTGTPIPSADVVLSKGTGLLRGTWMFDFEVGKEVAAGQGDVWWEQVDATHRYLVPQNGAKLALIGGSSYELVSSTLLRGLGFAGVRLDGSNSSGNTLTTNSIVGVRTHNGHYAKVAILAYGYDLTIAWTTFQ